MDYMRAAMAALVLSTACSRSEPRATVEQAKVGVDAGVEFVSDTFDRLYPIFLRHSLPAGAKASLWVSYRNHWVRWAGRLVSFTPNGITVKMRPATVTFDISLRMSAVALERAKGRYHAKDWIDYVGRFDSYDDVFRTFYLDNGYVVGSGSPPPDGGF
jgi:hypothetical protein